MSTLYAEVSLLEDAKKDHRRIENTMITGKGDKKANNDQLHTNPPHVSAGSKSGPGMSTLYAEVSFCVQSLKLRGDRSFY
jgi:hypothetical protein